MANQKEVIPFDLAAAEHAVADLEQERSVLAVKIDEASGRGDAAALITLVARGDELPLHILTARLKLERLHLEAIEEKLPIAADAFAESLAKLEKARENVSDAREAKRKQFEAGKPIEAAHNRLIREREDRKTRITKIEDMLHRHASSVRPTQSRNNIGHAHTNARI